MEHQWQRKKMCYIIKTCRGRRDIDIHMKVDVEIWQLQCSKFHLVLKVLQPMLKELQPAVKDILLFFSVINVGAKWLVGVLIIATFFNTMSFLDIRHCRSLQSTPTLFRNITIAREKLLSTRPPTFSATTFYKRKKVFYHWHKNCQDVEQHH